MKLLKFRRIYITLITICTISVILIFNDFLTWGLILLALAVIVFWIWRLFIKNKEDEISNLISRLDKIEEQNNYLRAENDELRNRKLNIAEIKSKLDLGLMEINTSFTRTWNDKFSHEKKEVHFIGALQVRIIARYGIDLKDLRVRIDQTDNSLTVANINPKFLSFNDLDYEWKIAEILEYKKPWIGANHWRKSNELQELGAEIKENLRVKIHQEVKNGCDELDWVIEPMKKQIRGILELLLGAPGRPVRFTDNFDDSFKALNEYQTDNGVTL